MGTQVTEERLERFRESLMAGRDESTVRKYMKDVRKLADYLDGAELSRDRMYGYRDWLGGRYKQRTTNSYLNTANQFCLVMGWDSMPVPLLRLDLDLDMEGDRCIPASTYRRLVSAAMGLGMQDTAMVIQVMCHTGLRISELGALTVGALEAGEVCVARRGRQRRLRIPGPMCRDLKAYAEGRGIREGVVFRTRNGNAVDRTNFWKRLKKLCGPAGVDASEVRVNRLKKPGVRDCYPYYPLC